MSAAEITSVASLIMSLIAIAGIVLAVVKYKPEQRITDSNAALNYQKIANDASAREVMFMSRIRELEARVSALEKQLKESSESAARFEDWARRLELQVRSLDGIPVPLDPIARKENKNIIENNKKGV